MSLESDIAFFFGEETEEYGSQLRSSTLHNLRSELRKCYSSETCIVSAMAICAGIDLLAKFAYGDKVGEVGERFKKYLRNYMEVKGNVAFFDSTGEMFNIPHSEILYQLRNAIHHSFGLFSKNHEYEFLFQLTVDRNIKLRVEENYTGLRKMWVEIGLDYFLSAFEESIKKLEGNVQKDRFDQMFKKYGSIYLS